MSYYSCRQDAIYQSVVARDKTTLAHLLCTISLSFPQKERAHPVAHSCPFLKALDDGSQREKKLSCLTLLLKYNYHCPCFTRWFDDSVDLLEQVPTVNHLMMEEDLNAPFYVINTELELKGPFKKTTVKVRLGEPLTLKVLARRELRKRISIHCRMQNKCENFYSALTDGLAGGVNKTNAFVPQELFAFLTFANMGSIVVKGNDHHNGGAQSEHQSFTCLLIDA